MKIKITTDAEGNRQWTIEANEVETMKLWGHITLFVCEKTKVPLEILQVILYHSPETREEILQICEKNENPITRLWALIMRERNRIGESQSEADQKAMPGEIGKL